MTKCDKFLGFLCLIFGIGIGVILTLCVYSDAINEHKFREYKQQNTNSVIEFNEWKRLRSGR